MTKRFKQIRNIAHHSARNQGQGIVEYVLLLVLVGIAVVAIVQVMQPAIGDVFKRMVDKNVVAPPALAGYTPPATYTYTPTIDPNITPSATPTNTPTATPTDTPVFTNTPTETAVPTNTYTPTATNTPQYLACEYVGSGGTVVIEAENFAHQELGNPSSSVWAANIDYTGYSGSMAVMVPNVGVNQGLTTNGPRLDYPVRLDVAGDYYIFVRGIPLSPDTGNNDSVHAGVDGTAITLEGTGLTNYETAYYNWQRWYAPVNLTAGQHTLNIWMREDGMIIDRVMLSTNPNIVGNGSNVNGPASSSAPAGCTSSLTVPPPTSTPTNTPTITPIPTNTPTPTPGAALSVYVSSSSSGTSGGVNYDDEDVLFYNGATDSWSMYLDLSDLGQGGEDLDAFAILSDGSVLMSFDGNATIPGIGVTVRDEDVVRFIPSSTGPSTSGTFEYYFDGSDVDLTDDVDAIAVLGDGRVLISTDGNVTLSGISVNNEDLVAFTPTQLGSNTSGSWAMYFDASDTGLGGNVEGARVHPSTGKIYLSIDGSTTLGGVGITASDIFACTPTSLGNNTACTYDSTLAWDGSNHDYSGENMDAMYIVLP